MPPFFIFREQARQQHSDIFAPMAAASAGNNYARPGGQQNMGNFITDRPSSKVGGGLYIYSPRLILITFEPCVCGCARERAAERGRLSHRPPLLLPPSSPPPPSPQVLAPPGGRSSIIFG